MVRIRPRPERVAGLRLIGILGDSETVHGLRAACGLGAAPAKLDRDEPHFALELARMRAHDGMADRGALELLLFGCRLIAGVAPACFPAVHRAQIGDLRFAFIWE